MAFETRFAPKVFACQTGAMRDEPSITADALHVHLVQPDVVWHDPPANYDRVRRMLDERPPTTDSLIVLPEMFATGFTNEISLAADTPDNATARWLEDLCAETHCHAIAGVAALDPLTGLGLNQAICVSPTSGEMMRYAKIHQFPLSREMNHFTAGDEVQTVNMAGVEVCPLVCYDLRFPETWRNAAGAAVFVLIANWPASRMHHWHALLRARAIENQAFVIGVNRTGTDPNVQYSGGSVVYDYDGHCLTEMDERPGLAATTLDLSAMREFRQKLPFLPKRSRRLSSMTT